MTLALRAGSATDPGRVRARNEDALLLDADLRLYAVADGLGGHRAGEVASAVAVDTIRDVVGAGAGSADCDRRQSWGLLVDALMQADAAIQHDSALHDERAGMGSTAVVAWFPSGPTLVLANVGDSRGYLLRGGELRQLTQDHTVFEALRRAGRLSDVPDEQPPRQVLSQALGAGTGVAPSVACQATATGDRVLLCSDGLTDLLTDAQIAKVLAAMPGEVQRACDELVCEANSRGGFDNVTVVLIEVGGEP